MEQILWIFLCFWINNEIIIIIFMKYKFNILGYQDITFFFLNDFLFDIYFIYFIYKKKVENI